MKTHTIIFSAIVLTTITFFGLMRMAAWHRFLPSDRPATDMEICACEAMDYAALSSERNDIIAVGDSCCATGFDPIVFEEHTRLRAYNLATTGFVGLAGVQTVLTVYLKHHPRPKAILLIAHPSFFAPPGENAAGVALANRMAACYDPSLLGTSWRTVAVVGASAMTHSKQPQAMIESRRGA